MVSVSYLTSESCKAQSVPENATIIYACDSINNVQADLRFGLNWNPSRIDSFTCNNGNWTISNQPKIDGKLKKDF